MHTPAPLEQLAKPVLAPEHDPYREHIISVLQEAYRFRSQHRATYPSPQALGIMTLHQFIMDAIRAYYGAGALDIATTGWDIVASPACCFERPGYTISYYSIPALLQALWAEETDL